MTISCGYVATFNLIDPGLSCTNTNGFLHFQVGRTFSHSSMVREYLKVIGVSHCGVSDEESSELVSVLGLQQLIPATLTKQSEQNTESEISYTQKSGCGRMKQYRGVLSPPGHSTVTRTSFPLSSPNNRQWELNLIYRLHLKQKHCNLHPPCKLFLSQQTDLERIEAWDMSGFLSGLHSKVWWSHPDD